MSRSDKHSWWNGPQSEELTAQEEVEFTLQIVKHLNRQLKAKGTETEKRAATRMFHPVIFAFIQLQNYTRVKDSQVVHVVLTRLFKLSVWHQQGAREAWILKKGVDKSGCHFRGTHGYLNSQPGGVLVWSNNLKLKWKQISCLLSGDRQETWSHFYCFPSADRVN